MSKYEVTVCDGEKCEVVGRARDAKTAERKAIKALKKKSKRSLRGGKGRGRVIASVFAVERGVVDTNPIFEAEERYGEPTRKRSRKPRREELSDASGDE